MQFIAPTKESITASHIVARQSWGMQSKEIASSLHSSQRRVAFTLSEVLITLVIIGVIAAITVPTLMNNSKWAQYRSAALKVQSTLDNALRLYHVKEGYYPQCGYWEKNPYGPSVCVEYTADGTCSKRTLENGDPLPPDYNNLTNDCPKVVTFLSKNLNIIKYCTSNARANGCIPDYDGIDTIYANKNSDKDLTEAEINAGTANFPGFRKQQIQASAALVLADGSIIVIHQNTYQPVYMVDINGEKGPNKWGQDIIFFTAKIKNRFSSPKFYPAYNRELVDKGGVSTYRLIHGKDLIH